MNEDIEMEHGNNVQNTVHGYKVFHHDWTCRGYQYAVGETYKKDYEPICCSRGFHFCKNAADCFNYYNFDPKNKVAEVIALGEVDTYGEKSCTNKIKILREISWQELLTIVNTGNHCTGLRNTGNYNAGNNNTGSLNVGDGNTGNYNTGNRNVGSINTGDCNTGNHNAGNFNIGNCNTGSTNKGSFNTGNSNTGRYNTGDWNKGSFNTGEWNNSSFNTGCFNTKEHNIMMFNKPSGITGNEWMNSDARFLLIGMPRDAAVWVPDVDMTDEEKEEYPTFETTLGYIKMIDESDGRQLWWDGLGTREKNIIKSIPNFDAEIFYQCTGIRVDDSVNSVRADE